MQTAWPLPFDAFHDGRSLLAVAAFADAVLHLIGTEQPINAHFAVSDRSPISITDISRAIRHGLDRLERLVDMPPGR